MADLGSRTLAAVLLHSMSERVRWPDLRLAVAAMALRVAPAARTPATPPSMVPMHMHFKILRLNKNKLSLQMDMKELKLRAGFLARVNMHMNVSAGTDPPRVPVLPACDGSMRCPTVLQSYRHNI